MKHKSTPLIGFIISIICHPLNAETIKTDKLTFELETVIEGMAKPWGMAALPNGDMLITERGGTLRIMLAGGALHPDPIADVPQVAVIGQGGLLDVAIHPEFQTNGWVYLSYAAPKAEGEPGEGANTALMRAKINNHQLVDQQLLFKALPNYTAGQHFGSRIAFDEDNHVYLSVGDRARRDEVQTLENHRGKIFRLNDDGSVPTNNPFVNTLDAKPETWSWGHRNPQGMERHPISGEIWSHEHGPKGGDELNKILFGQNYGWPIATFGIDYNGTSITDQTAQAGLKSPITHWTPSIAPSGMTFVTGDKYPEWQNNLLVGSLKFQQLRRLELNDEEINQEEILFEGFGRVRAIEQGTDGFIYVAEETNGRILKLVPKR